MAYKYFFDYMYQSLIWKLQYIISNMNFLLSIYQSLSNDVYARNLCSFAELVTGQLAKLILTPFILNLTHL